MSTISEVDIRDWDKVGFKETSKVVDDWQLADWYKVQEYHKFFKQVELIRDKQIKASQQSVAALLRRPE